MPELPEVETIRRGLTRRIVGKKIVDVTVRTPKLVRGDVTHAAQFLKGRHFSRILRRGKLLIVEVGDTDQFLLIHLKMTGQLIYQAGQKFIAGGHGYPPIGELPNKYSHIIFTFADKTKLYFNDMRQFGYVRLVDAATKDAIWQTYGPEPLDTDFTWTALAARLKRRTSSLKSVLLDQAVVAGLGNIYVDEACWRARVRPQRRAHTLTAVQTKQLFAACRKVLQQAIDAGGTTFSDYHTVEGEYGGFTRFLRVYDRAGLPCRRCQTIIRKTRAAGRGTHFCPQCQI